MCSPIDRCILHFNIFSRILILPNSMLIPPPIAFFHLANQFVGAAQEQLLFPNPSESHATPNLLLNCVEHSASAKIETEPNEKPTAKFAVIAKLINRRQKMFTFN